MVKFKYTLKLIIDIGNSLIKIGLFQEKNKVRSKEFQNINLAKVKDFVQDQPIVKAILSSVREIDKDILGVVNYYKALVLDEHVSLPIKVNYKSPNTLGKDRLSGVVGASYLYPGNNILVLDFGTCLTIDFINKKKEYLGGRISPGLNMRYRALNEFTSKLPYCQFTEVDKFIGNDTVSSIHTGIQRGIISEVYAIISEFKKENDDTIVIFTGGDCFFFEKEFKNSIFAHPFLIMVGLNAVSYTHLTLPTILLV